MDTEDNSSSGSTDDNEVIDNFTWITCTHNRDDSGTESEGKETDTERPKILATQRDKPKTIVKAKMLMMKKTLMMKRVANGKNMMVKAKNQKKKNQRSYRKREKMVTRTKNQTTITVIMQ
jgi:hypothetical protein